MNACCSPLPVAVDCRGTAPRALSAESKNAPWPITEQWSATTWHRSVLEARYDDQFVKLRRALGIIAGTKIVTT